MGDNVGAVMVKGGSMVQVLFWADTLFDLASNLCFNFVVLGMF